MAAELKWKRSSYSASGGGDQCVECADDSRVIRIRDSKDRGEQQLEVPLAGWRAFVNFVCS